jgi:hypothetical protein
VDVTGIEPATPCLQSSQTSSRKSRSFRHSITNSRVSFVQRMCAGVPECRHLHVGSLQKSLQSAAIQIGADS